MIEFKEFPKVGRLMRDVVITEKIDGTNASILIDKVYMSDFDAKAAPFEELVDKEKAVAVKYEGETPAMFYIRAASRTRLIDPHNDNFGFANWVWGNAPQLWTLGPGHHFGEWWGKGIQRNYGQEGRKFSLFNVTKWTDSAARPDCCDVVPMLYTGPLFMAGGEFAPAWVMRRLEFAGSTAAPGFKPPEGIMVFHTADSNMKKFTFEGDGHKGAKVA